MGPFIAPHAVRSAHTKPEFAYPNGPRYAALKAIMALGTTDTRYGGDAHYVGGAVGHTNLQWGVLFKTVMAGPPDPAVVGEAWPKLFQPDYTEVVTKILQAKPQALYSCLWGGDLTSYIDQANIYALFGQMEVFAVNMADYTALTVVKNLPKGIHSGNRYIKTYPATAENAAWGDAYKAKYGEYPTNWSWENATAMQLLAEASKKANSADGKKIAEALKGLKIKSPFGADGTVTMRAEDNTLVGYAIGWGTTIPQEPYVPDVKPGDWKMIFELEAEWKKGKGYT